MALFMLTLFFTLPFYSASALAANMQVVSSRGDDAVEGYLDSQGDTWRVQVQISGVETAPDPAQVKMIIGDNQAAFNSCTQGALGFLCDYISPVGVAIREGAYAFNVLYNLDLTHPEDLQFNPHTSGVVTADGTAPVFVGQPTANQDKETGDIVLDLRIKDRPQVGAGITKVEVVNADSNQILQTVVLEPAKREYIFAEDSNHNGRLPRFEGVGQRRIKVRAYDALGHMVTSPAIAFNTDSIAPDIAMETLRFLDRSEFMGPFESFATLSVNVTETSDELRVIATAPETDLDGRAGDCALTDTPDVYTCLWTNVRIPPVSSLTITLDAVDGFNNKAQSSKTINFVQDLQAPEIVFFGTNTVFEDQSYISKDLDGEHPQQKVVLVVNEQGAGVSVNTIKANLGALGGSTLQSPDRCDVVDGQYRCEWDVNPKAFSSEGVAVLTLPQFEDAVGNAGATQEVPVIVDIHGPVVDTMSVFGLSAAGDKDYFQSGDALKIKFNVTERSGLQILVGMHDLATDLETKFPETDVSQGLGVGYQAFDSSSCTRKPIATPGGETVESFVWDCEIITEAIKSGPDSHAEFDLIVRDTAGNDGQFLQEAKNVEGVNGRYAFNLLGLLSEEVSPDFWEVGSAVPNGFIDLDTTHLIAARLPVSVVLKQKTPNVEALDLRLEGCAIAVPAAASGPPSVVNSVSERANREAADAAAAPEESFTNPTISKTILYGGLQGIEEGQTTPQILFMLEFAPFDGKEQFIDRFRSQTPVQGNFVEVPITCNLNIFSKLGSNAISSSEQQALNFTAKFGFTEIGAIDENLKGKIQGIKDQFAFQIADTLEIITDIVRWVQYAQYLVQAITTVANAVNLITASGDSLRYIPGGAVAALVGCTSNVEFQGALQTVINVISVPMQIIQCNPKPLINSNIGPLTWYGKYQKGVLDVYNEITMRRAFGVPATNLYENIWTSVAGVCPTGILYNLEKYRQVKCRTILCYQEDVPSGLATVDTCAKVDEYLTCKYWAGPIANLGPFELWDQIMGILRNILSSPLGLLREVLLIPCYGACGVSNKASSACVATGTIVHLFDFINTIVDAYNNFPTKVSNSYCDRI